MINKCLFKTGFSLKFFKFHVLLKLFVYFKNITFNNYEFIYVFQHGCTALCYAIAFMIQKRLDTPNPSLEQLVAAVNDESSKLTLEVYLKVSYKNFLSQILNSIAIINHQSG